MTTPSPGPAASPDPAPSMTSYHDGRLVVWGGDCLALMAAMAPNSVDAIVTDPPYGLGFMGKKWDDQAVALDEQSGTLKSGANPTRRSSDKFRDDFKGQTECTPARGVDVGGASRFFYCAKAPKAERPTLILEDGTKLAHPTVKPVAVMRWLVRLVTPPDGLVLDTFAGTGTTGEACVLEGFRCLLAEDPTKGEQDYLPLIDLRITRAVAQLPKTEPMEQTA